MTEAPKLAARLANQALAETEHPAIAAAALMTAAAAILARDCGQAAAAELMLEMVAMARQAVIADGLVAEVTRH